MRLLRLLPVALLASLAALPAAAQAADVPSNRTLYEDGPSGRFLMDGQWLFRLDTAGQGMSQRFYRQTSTAGWTPVTVPNVWNVGDDSEASMRGSVGWYRKDFELPDKNAALEWAVRFESVNYRTRVWLNGRDIGSNTGAYIPFTVRLDNALRHTGVNRLVIRVNSRRLQTDFPPSGLSSRGAATGGWWNYGGIQREVYLQRLDTVSFDKVRVLPRTSGSSATVDFTVALENVTNRARRVSAIANYGGRRVGLGTRRLRPGQTELFEGRVRISGPQLWTPKRPFLYQVRITAASGGRTVGTYDLKSGIRSFRVSSNGRLYLNGSPLNVRGVGVHEDNRQQGFAVDNAFRDRLVAEARAVGATMLRTHYPMHPYVHELADRLGLMIWSEIPVYAVKTHVLAKKKVRMLAAQEMRRNVEANLNHPSVAVWSIGNELSSRPGPVQGDYIARAAGIAKDIDPTRPVGIAFAGYPSAGCQAEYRPLDVLGVNDYFGWYPGPSGQLFDRTKLSGYLDSVRRCYPRQAIMVTEFGAEANRDGPVEEKGTWAFQQEWINFHLGVFASKPWLSGALYWALNEFRVKPDWEGGNPRPQPPIHQKGLLTYDGMSRKPAWVDVQRAFSGTAQTP